VLVDRRGSVRRLNQQAEDLFGADLVIRHRRIRATDRASDARLQTLITAAVSRPSGWSIGADPVVIDRSGCPWLLVDVMPITSFGHDLFNGGDALLYFTNLAAQRALSERLLSAAFHLTAAEARLAAGLAAGEGIAVASARLRIGRETARTQLRAIFAKTGTRRQAELTALLSRLHAPLPAERRSLHPFG
jgi:DNA-binding CsgD family transcriptional regulator